MSIEESLIAQKALRAIEQYVSHQAPMPSFLPDENRADVAIDLHNIRDALQGLARKNYSDCDACSSDKEAVSNIVSAISDIRLFAPRMAEELEPVRQLADKMVAIETFREHISPKTLSAIESPPAHDTESQAR